MRTRANHFTSSSADAKSSRQAWRRRALISSGMPMARASTIAARTHHNQDGGPFDSDDVGWTDGDVVGDGAVVVWVGWVGCVGRLVWVGVGLVAGAVVCVGSDD